MEVDDTSNDRAHSSKVALRLTLTLRELVAASLKGTKAGSLIRARV